MILIDESKLGQTWQGGGGATLKFLTAFRTYEGHPISSVNGLISQKLLL